MLARIGGLKPTRNSNLWFTVYDLRASWRPLTRRNVLIVSVLKTLRTSISRASGLPQPGQWNEVLFQPGINFYLALTSIINCVPFSTNGTLNEERQVTNLQMSVSH